LLINSFFIRLRVKCPDIVKIIGTKNLNLEKRDQVLDIDIIWER